MILFKLVFSCNDEQTFKYYDEEEDEGELKKLGGADLFNPLGTTLPNISKSTTPTLTIEFKKYPHEMKYPGQEMIGRNTTRKVPVRLSCVNLVITTATATASITTPFHPLIHKSWLLLLLLFMIVLCTYKNM